MNMKSKVLILFLMIGITFITGFNCTQAQNTPADKQVVAMLREFYTAYMTEFPEISPSHDQKLKAILKKYCTANLIKKFPKLADQIDADPILNAQDSDAAWTKTLEITKDPKKAGVFTVSYRDGGNTSSTIHLLVVKQKDGYKVDAVWY